jgi:hypothetical protein
MALVKIGKVHGLDIAEPSDYAEIKDRNPSPEQLRRLFENMVTKYKGSYFKIFFLFRIKLNHIMSMSVINTLHPGILKTA